MTLTILIGLTIAVLLFLAIGLGDKIFNGMSFQSMAFQLSEFAMLSLGMGLVMLLGGIDLGIVANANMSVSYTHLDVYKRQELFPHKGPYAAFLPGRSMPGADTQFGTDEGDGD